MPGFDADLNKVPYAIIKELPRIEIKEEVMMSPEPNLEPRIVKLETKVELVEKNIDEIRKLLEKIDTKLDVMTNKLENKIDNINNRLWINFYWIIGSYAAGFMALLGFMSKGFHWW